MNKSKIAALEERVTRLEASQQLNLITHSGLVWSSVAPKEMTWSVAMTYAENLREGGYDDWRLPTIRELMSIFDYTQGEPEIAGFDPIDSYWSSIEDWDDPSDGAWALRLDHGLIGVLIKMTSSWVRCVRDEKN